MGKGNHGVSGYTHTQSQLDDYANQNNPNNDAYWANQDNHAKVYLEQEPTSVMSFRE